VVDPDLVRAAQRGDGVALSQLMDVVAPYVGRLCGPIALDAGPDAAQEALIQVFRDLNKLREPGALLGWVRRIAIREAIRHAQRSRRESPAPAVAAELPAPGDPALAFDVKSVLDTLAPEQRAILVLRDLEGLSEAETAEQLEVARGTAKSRLHRARAAFLDRWRESA
jgi:RNA polymerase sigma factor (sigma-70 family)